MIDNILVSKELTLSISSIVSNAARALIWDVFFVSRQRGIDLLSHFPWLNESSDIYSFTLSKGFNDKVVATLVLRLQKLPTGSCFAMIGMVCVDPSWRGRGLSEILLSNVLTFALEHKINSLILWTGKPGVYTKHGFQKDTNICDTFGKVTFNLMQKQMQVGFSKKHCSTSIGLPPFGKQLIRFCSVSAELICVETSSGISLVEWQGNLSAVMELIEAALPQSWDLNAPSNDAIFNEIRKRGHLYIPLPCPVRMIRHMDAHVSIPYISILGRI